MALRRYGATARRPPTPAHVRLTVAFHPMIGCRTGPHERVPLSKQPAREDWQAIVGRRPLTQKPNLLVVADETILDMQVAEI
jgi:hypothetical protein